MNTALRPATVQALARFRERRTRLLLVRAALTAMGVLLALLILVAVVDRCAFMPDGLRQGLGYAVYAGALAAAWWMSVRFVTEAQGLFGAARIMETADSRMHEKLLAAVELSQGSQENLPDSPEFRARLQDEVAADLTGFDPEKVLPMSLLLPWMKALAAMALLAGILSLVPGLHLPGFMARAALPFANLPRPSSTKVLIVTPVNPDAVVPIASSTPLGVQIEGRVPKRVMVETQSGGGKPARMELSHAGGNRFEGLVGIGQTSVRYRIVAGDALTEWHTLDARPRPRVVQFQKITTPPAYAGLPETTVVEDHGELGALEGSTVKLILQTNQPVSDTAATLSPGAEPLVISHAGADRLAVSIPINGKSDAWQIALTARETGFTNEEATPWRIETIPDLPPTVTITRPAEQLEVRSDDEISVSGQASDDIGLARIEISHAINGTDWKEAKLPEDKRGKEIAVTTAFKLAPLPVKPGDSVLVKLVATDVKGQRSESSPVRLFIVEDKLDLAQRQWAAQQRRLAAAAQTLAEEARDLRKEAERVRALDRKGGRNEQQAQESEAAMAKLKQHLAAVEEQSAELWEQLKQAAQQAPNPLKALETNLTGQRLAELRGQHLKELREQAQAENMDERQFKDAANQVSAEAEMVAQALRTFAAADSAQAVREAMEHLAPQQTRLADKAIDANRNLEERAKWQEQQRAALAAAESARKDLEDLREVLPDGRKREAGQVLENLNRKLPGLLAALDHENQHQAPEFIYGQSHEMRNATNQARDITRGMAEEAAAKAQELRERLLQQQNPALAAIDQARDNAARAASQKRQPEKEESQQDQAADKLAAAARQLKDQSELREQSHQTNTQAALDMNRMGRALEHLAEQVRGASSPEALKEATEKARQLAETARALQADAQAQDAAQALEQSREAAMTSAPAAGQLPAAQAAASQLRQLPEALRRAQAGNEAANAAQEAAGMAQWQRDETQSQQRQMADQKQAGQDPQPLPPQQNRALEANARASQKLAEAMTQFAPKVAEARGRLEQMTPSLSGLAQDAAAALQRSQEQVSQAADAAQNNQTPEQTAAQAAALLPKAEEDAQKLADLQAALRQEANAADLADAAQRQMARTADVGLAQMRNQTPRITQNLQQAASGRQTSQQAEALRQAAQAQQQTAQALQQLAQNLERMEQGQTLPEDALAAQNAMEEALGIKQPLDQSYNEAAELAKLLQAAQQDPKKALAALEEQLKKSPPMQLALSHLAGQSAQESQSQLAQAQVQPELTQTAAAQGAHTLARVARHNARLDQPEAARTVAQAGEQLEKMAQAARTDPAQNNAQNAEKAALQAKAAQEAAAKAAAAQAEKLSAPGSFMEAAKGAMLAQALDELDQAVHPMGAEPQQQAQGSQGEPQQGLGQPQPGQSQTGKPSAQENAQQSLAQAGQSQSQSMAQARAQGVTPGQQAPQTARQPGSQGKGQNQEASPDATGNLTQGQANLIVPVLSVVEGGDWGHLPSRMAKDLTEASRQEPSPEYREAIQSYYKAIAEKARK